MFSSVLAASSISLALSELLIPSGRLPCQSRSSLPRDFALGGRDEVLQRGGEALVPQFAIHLRRGQRLLHAEGDRRLPVLAGEAFQVAADDDALEIRVEYHPDRDLGEDVAGLC